MVPYTPSNYRKGAFVTYPQDFQELRCYPLPMPQNTFLIKRALNNLEDITARIDRLQAAWTYPERLQSSVYCRLMEEADMWCVILDRLGYGISADV